MKKEYEQFYQNTYEERQERMQYKRRTSQREIRTKRLVIEGVFLLSCLIVLGVIIFTFRHYYHQMEESTEEIVEEIVVPDIIGAAEVFPELNISEQFLTINRYSRPGLPLTTSPQYIVIHYTANPDSTAQQNRDYFENLKDTQQTFASAQFVIGLDGEIIQCVPCNEIAYCSNSYNEYCISIEMCHSDTEGNFHDATYNNCVYLVAKLMNYYNLDMSRLIRHYDITGKNCPKYFVEHEDRWEVFKGFVEEYREKYTNEIP